MSNDVCVRGNLILPDRILARGYLLVREGTIRAIGNSRPGDWTGPIFDAGEEYVCPGFVDLHVHGGGGADYMDGSPEAVRKAATCAGTRAVCPITAMVTPVPLMGVEALSSGVTL